MNRTLFGSLLVAAVLVTVGTSTTLAQTSRSGAYTKSYGNSKAGGNINVYGSMNRTSSSTSVSGWITGNVKLLGQTREAARIQAAGSKSASQSSGSVTVKVGGNTVWSSSLSSSGSRNFSSTFPLWSPPAVPVPVGPVTVWISGNAGVGAGLNLSWAFVQSTRSVCVDGFAHGWAYGSASANLGVPGYNIGLQLNLNLMDQGVGFGMHPTTTSLQGSLSYDFYPINILLKAVLNAWPFSWQHTLSSYTPAPYSTGNLLN
jgi:hypothetical protein